MVGLLLEEVDIMVVEVNPDLIQIKQEQVEVVMQLTQ